MERLTLKEISALVDMPESSLGKFLDDEEKKRFFGAVGRPPLYPEEAIPLFQALKQLRDEKVVKPQNFLELRDLITTRSGENPKPESGYGALAVSDPQNLFSDFGPADLGEIIRESIRQGVAQALEAERLQNPPVPPTDAALTRQQAADLLQCHPSTVSRYVEPTRRGRYSSLMVQAKLREWREDAEARQAARETSPPRVTARKSTPQLPPPPDEKPSH